MAKTEHTVTTRHLSQALTSDYGSPSAIVNISALVRSTPMKQIAVDSSMKKLSTEALTLQTGHAESPLASFLLVLSFYGES